jgi:peptidyl-prolyl cis-trans isomerase C
MKSSVFTRVFVLAGLAAATLSIGAAQQPLTPPPAPGTPKAAAPEPESNLPPDAVVMVIGDRKITRAEFEQLLSAVAQNGKPATTAAAKRQMASQYGELQAMAMEARRRKLEDDPNTKMILSIQTDSILANMLARKIQDDVQFSDQDLQAYYKAHQQDFDELQGAHILIRFKGSNVPLKAGQKDLTEAEALARAQDLRAKIVAGADFATIAKAESDDAGTAVKGGDLGTFRHGQMVPTFDKEAFALPVNQISEPVKTQFGYHLIKITSRKSKTFEEAKGEIEKGLKPQMTRQTLEKIRAGTPVTLNDEYFGKPQAAAAPGSPTPKP